LNLRQWKEKESYYTIIAYVKEKAEDEESIE
jgi:hypothetical protein